MQGLLKKQAGPDVTALQLQQAGESTARAQVLRVAMQMGLLGLGVGAGARGIQGLVNMGYRNLVPTKTTRTPSVVDIPVPAAEEDEKLAQDFPQKSKWMDRFMHPAAHLSKWFKGDPQGRFRDVPFGLIPPLAVGGAAIGAGWKGLDLLLDRSRERELAVQQAKAREEYEQALAAQSKVGQALHAELDSLFEKLSDEQCREIEKAAFGGWGDLTNLYGVYAMITGIPASVWAYEATKKRQQSSVLEEARKRYQRSRESARPSPVFVRPAPSAMRSAPDQDELEGAPLDKAAGRGLIPLSMR